jgi:hypothetical protein
MTKWLFVGKPTISILYYPLLPFKGDLCLGILSKIGFTTFILEKRQKGSPKRKEKR